MQRSFTIELRVEYADEAKYEQIKGMLRSAALHLHASAALIADGQKPDIVISGTDFFHGFEDIKLFDDTIAKGQAAIATADDPEGKNQGDISQDLLDAMKN